MKKYKDLEMKKTICGSIALVLHGVGRSVGLMMMSGRGSEGI